MQQQSEPRDASKNTQCKLRLSLFKMAWLLLITALLLQCVAASAQSVELRVKRVVDSGLANVHIEFQGLTLSELAVTYGP